MVNSDPPEDPAPPIEKGTTKILQQVLAHNQEMMWLLSAKSGKIIRNNINRPPTPSNRPSQGQYHHPMPTYFDKYRWKHVRASHKGGNCNSKASGQKDKATIENKIDRRNYGCTEWWCGTVTMVETNNNRNILLNSTDSTSVPPKLNSYKHALIINSTKTINLKNDTDTTGNYIWYKYTISS